MIVQQQREKRGAVERWAEYEVQIHGHALDFRPTTTVV
jgi:hypothetical protein